MPVETGEHARPLGVALLAISHLPLAVVNLLWDAVLVASGGVPGVSLVGLALLLRLLLAAMLLVSASGLWRGWPPAWTLAVCAYVAGVVVNGKMLFELWPMLRHSWRNGEELFAILLVMRFGVEIAAYAGCFAYAVTESARAHFRGRRGGRGRRA